MSGANPGSSRESSHNFARPENFARKPKIFCQISNRFDQNCSFLLRVRCCCFELVPLLSRECRLMLNTMVFSPFCTLFCSKNNALMGSAVEAQESSVETTSENLADGEAQPETGKTQSDLEHSTDFSEQIYQLTIVLPAGQTPRTIKVIVNSPHVPADCRPLHKSLPQTFGNILYLIRPPTT
jgi:hypothetical protein